MKKNLMMRFMPDFAKSASLGVVK